MFLSSWYLHHFWGPPGFLFCGKWHPFCYKDWHMKLATDVYLLPGLRVHLHFPVWHNCHGKNHRNSFTFALCLGFSSLFCHLLCFLFHASSFSLHSFVYGISLWLVSPPWQLKLPLLCTHMSARLLSTCTVCAIFCISSFTLLSTSSLVQGSSFFDIFSFEAVEGTSCPCVALCISSLHYYLVSFLADSFLPSCKKGPDIHSFGKWFKNRRTDKLWKTADDSQGSPRTYQHVLVTLRSADNVGPWWETYIFISLCGLTAAANWVMPAFYCMHDRWTTPFKCHGGTESTDNG